MSYCSFHSFLAKTRFARTAVMWTVLAVLAAGCGDRERPLPTADGTSLRSTEQGRVVGYVGDYGNHVWRGIDYAKAPVGDLRWRAPENPSPWAETREALRQGAYCPQFVSRFGGVTGEEGEIKGNEDCLFLDIYAKRRETSAVPSGDERVPVLFWIHGGGNVIGHAGFYDGGFMAETHDVVVVAINYRLGPLGWFRHASLRDSESSAADRSGNFGTLDMIRALEWVRDNIAAFGGDPSNVTIFGESAGAKDVFSLLLSPRAKGLFHRAVAQSGSTYFTSIEAAENRTEEGGAAGSSNEVLLVLLQEEEGAGNRDEAKARLAEMTSTEIAEYLRGQSAEALLGSYLNDQTEGLIEMPLTFREGEVIPLEDARERFSDPETWNVVPVIAGTNRDENKLFMYADPEYVKYRFGFLPRMVDEERFNLEARYRSLMWKASGADEPLGAMRLGSDAVWSYRFDWDEEPSVLGADLSVMLGAAHGFEIPFVFGHFSLGEAGDVIFTDDNLPGRQELSRAMMSYWAEFAATGDPGRGRDGSLPQWSGWNPDEKAEKFMIFDTTGGGGLRMAPGSVTQSSVLAMAEADPSLAARDDRCVILSQIVAWSDVALPIECEGIDPAIEGSEVAPSTD